MNHKIISVQKQFKYYKSLGEKTFEQIPASQLFRTYNEDSNSIAIIVKHLSGNMLSRWTDFLTSDGEKEWRNRDDEFADDIRTKESLLEYWEKGWSCLFNALAPLTNDDLEKEIFIRNMGHTVYEALLRQLAHYAYHVGQIVFIGKMNPSKEWKSLSIPKGNSSDYNADKFAKPKQTKHFTDDL